MKNLDKKESKLFSKVENEIKNSQYGMALCKKNVVFLGDLPPQEEQQEPEEIEEPEESIARFYALIILGKEIVNLSNSYFIKKSWLAANKVEP